MEKLDLYDAMKCVICKEPMWGNTTLKSFMFDIESGQECLDFNESVTNEQNIRLSFIPTKNCGYFEEDYEWFPRYDILKKPHPIIKMLEKNQESYTISYTSNGSIAPHELASAKSRLKKLVPYYNYGYEKMYQAYIRKHNLNLSYRQWWEKSKWILIDECSMITENQKKYILDKCFGQVIFCGKLESDYKKKKKEYNGEKITCECGAVINRSGLSRHKKSKKHIEFVN